MGTNYSMRFGWCVLTVIVFMFRPIWHYQFTGLIAWIKAHGRDLAGIALLLSVFIILYLVRNTPRSRERD